MEKLEKEIVKRRRDCQENFYFTKCETRNPFNKYHHKLRSTVHACKDYLTLEKNANSTLLFIAQFYMSSQN